MEILNQTAKQDRREKVEGERERDTNATKGWSGCSTGGAGVARWEDKWDPLLLQEGELGAVEAPAFAVAGGYVPFPPSFSVILN